ncbi:MAG TPA: hypothetical protein VK948_08580 [Aeromicrobium sp.]|nr:hypothetical protein [Aeromicrobium sp.]
MQLSKGEVRKDQIQQTSDAAVAAIGNIVSIGVESVRKVIHEIGTFATEVYEIRESGRRAEADGAEADGAEADGAEVDVEQLGADEA